MVCENNLILVPTAIFADRSISFSESIVEYLWTEHRLGPAEIGRLLSMDRRNVYTLMQRVCRRARRVTRPTDNIFVPVSVFSSRKVSMLEALICHLRDNTRLTNKQTALLLDRSEKTISTAYIRGGERA
jgi:DNA-binding CsgD family transcriptional regulator